jgi:hypothetical protein
MSLDSAPTMTPLSSALGSAAAAVAAADPYSAHWALYPRSYTVQRAPPGFSVNDVDGDLTKNAWRNVPWSDAFDNIQGSHDAPQPPPHAIPLTHFKALYDDTHLYIGAMLHPSHEFATQAHFTQHNSPIFQKDSDFEVFIDVHGSNHNYKELEVNALNTVWNLLLDKPYGDNGHEHSGRIAQPGDADYYEVYQQKTAVQVLQGKLNDDAHHTGALWSVEMALSYTDLYNNGNLQPTTISTTGDVFSPPPTPRPGTFWRINFSRVELKGDVNWTWQPQVIWDVQAQAYQGKIDMHLPDAWGYLVFAGDDRNEDDDDDTAVRRPVLLPPRDESWPLRLAAMNIYYAQRVYRERHGKYACCVTQLEQEQMVDPNILAPFVVTIMNTDSSQGGEDNNMKDQQKIDDSVSYTAKIQCKQDTAVDKETTTKSTTATSLNESKSSNNKPLYATITQERLLRVVWSSSSSSSNVAGRLEADGVATQTA